MEEVILCRLHSLLAATAFGFCRLAPTFYLLPFFASGNTPTIVRHPIIIVVSCASAQHYHYELLNLNEIDIALLAARETIIGLFITCLLASPLWVLLTIGSFTDNQRGATLSSILDPATSVDTSELVRLFNLFPAAVHLTKGGMNFVPETLRQSCNLWSSGNFNFPKLKPLFSYINNMTTHTTVYASPVIAATLGGEAVPGLLACYASQLNVLAISPAIKSTLAFLILITYSASILVERVTPLFFFPEQLRLYIEK